MAADDLAEELGLMACAQLAGKAPVHAGSGVTAATRRFGLILATESSANSELTAAPLETGLSTCREKLAKTIVAYGKDTASDPQFMANAAAQMNAAGVTTVICLCH